MSINWQIGDRIRDRWEIHNILKGGMGVVYVVYDHQWREAFAVKTFQEEAFRRDPTSADRFRQEVLTWVNLDAHKNVTRARFLETIEGRPLLFLEYVAGGDLGDWIGTPRLTEDLPQVLRFAIHFCDGMTHALSHGIEAHRDIKPANCLLTDDMTLKVTDFGLAKAMQDDGGEPFPQPAAAGEPESRPSGLLSRLFGARQVISQAGAGPGRSDSRSIARIATQTGVGAGTPPYMAPEQFDDFKRVDVRGDIYSFGVMLYQMATGRLPFIGRTWEEIKRLHKEQRSPLLPARAAVLNDVVQRCLAKDPSARYCDFGAVRRQLASEYETLTGQSAPRPAEASELDVAAWGNKGYSLGNLGRHDDAMACYDRALQIDPRDAHTWCNKGYTLNAVGRSEEALAYFDRALQIDPRYAHAWCNKGNALNVVGRSEEALACCDRALEIDPRHAPAWNNKGNSLANLGRREDALACYDRALETDPRHAPAWNNKGNSLADLGRREDALACYDRALEVDPLHAAAWSNKGATLNDVGRSEEALDCFDRALQIDPRYAQTWCNKGKALNAIGRREEALACYDRALEMDPRHAPAWNNKGHSLADLGRREDALACYDRALQIDPRDAVAWSNKGSTLNAVGRSEEALTCYDRALEINPRHAAAWNNKGNNLASLGRREDALACYDRALEIDPHDAAVWFNKGAALANLGRLKDALACLETAHRLGFPRAGAAIETIRTHLQS